MNYWRLLLLAVVAVFQPIATFTERNLVDGRQECCERQPSTAFRDTKTLLHGRHYPETTSALRLLNDRTEIREHRRYALRQRESVISRLSRGRSIRDGEERSARYPAVTARSSRVESRFERSDNHLNRGGLETNDKDRIFDNVRDLKYETRRVVDRSPRDAEDRRNTQDDSLRYISTRNSVNRLSDERPSKSEMREGTRLRKLRFAPNRETRDMIRQTRDSATIYLTSRSFVERDRLSVARRESLTHRITSANINERRESERLGDQRQMISENTRLTERIRLESREEENKENVTMLPTLPKTKFERSSKAENFRDSELTRENADRRFERVQVARRDNREAMTRDVSARDDIRKNTFRRMSQRAERRNNPESRNNRIQVEIREGARDERVSRDARVTERRISRETFQMDRVANTLNGRNIDERRETSRARDVRANEMENTNRRMSQERFQVERRITREASIRNLDERNFDDRQQVRDENISRDTRDNNRQMSPERLERKNGRETNVRNILNERNVDERREVRDERMTRGARENTDRRMSRERSQSERRNVRDTRVTNTVNERNLDDRQEVRDQRISRDAMADKTENTDRRMGRERLQVERRNTREARIINILAERNANDRREFRDEKMSRDVRADSIKNTDRRIARERLQVERRNTREARIIDTLTERKVDESREAKDERMSRDIRAVKKEYTERRMARERLQVERRNNREARIMNTLAERNADERQEARDERTARDVRADNKENTDRRMTRERLQLERGNIREARLSANVENRRLESRENANRRMGRERLQVEHRNSIEARDERREIRAERKIREARAESREHTDRRISHEREQGDQRTDRLKDRNVDSPREDRRMARNARNGDERREMRAERIIREARADSRENTVRRVSRERVQVERRIDRSRDSVNERTIDGRREVRDKRMNRDSRDNARVTSERQESREDNQIGRVSSDNRNTRNVRLSRQIREIKERRSESRLNRVVAIDRADRRARSADRQNYGEIKAESGRFDRRDQNENRDREEVGRSRNVRTIANINGKTENEDAMSGSWQYVLYSLQGAYLCALFIKMMTPSIPEKSKMMSRWLPATSYYNPIKVD
ncbi:trichohyalin-like [Trichoplusia ni]|uniref:Trichohyalin-like n=1 Tax=Trichoplusia ni TaxID=7111 RepID=A0A7E5X025_TRINI|nr:trichohyalin-like [Trichoplusia ni]